MTDGPNPPTGRAIPPPPPPRRMRGRPLRTLAHVARALRTVFRECEAGRMSNERARVLAYVAVSLAQITRDGELEERVRRLERAAGPAAPPLRVAP